MLRDFDLLDLLAKGGTVTVKLLSVSVTLDFVFGLASFEGLITWL
jgi:hypothetical protein